MTYNHELFDRVIQRITMDPEAFDMRHWMREPKADESPHCGTVGCLAGHTLMELGYKPMYGGHWLAGRPLSTANAQLGVGPAVEISLVAAKALGLSTEEAEQLFTIYEQDYEYDYASDKPPQAATKEDVINRWKRITEGVSE